MLGNATLRGRGAPLPWDSTAQRESGELGNESADTRASLVDQYDIEQNDLGLGPGADNPYGASAENRRNLANRRRGVLSTAGNSLYSGSTINKSREATAAYDRRQKQIEDEGAESQATLDRGLSKVGRDEALGNVAIAEGAVNRAVEAEPEPLAVGRRKVRGRGRGFQGQPSPPENARTPNRARRNRGRS